MKRVTIDVASRLRAKVRDFEAALSAFEAELAPVLSGLAEDEVLTFTQDGGGPIAPDIQPSVGYRLDRIGGVARVKFVSIFELAGRSL
jgi:hypothetical protein